MFQKMTSGTQKRALDLPPPKQLKSISKSRAQFYHKQKVLKISMQEFKTKPHKLMKTMLNTDPKF